jgi:hypothetical protein
MGQSNHVLHWRLGPEGGGGIRRGEIPPELLQEQPLTAIDITHTLPKKMLGRVLVKEAGGWEEDLRLLSSPLSTCQSRV